MLKRHFKTLQDHKYDLPIVVGFVSLFSIISLVVYAAPLIPLRNASFSFTQTSWAGGWATSTATHALNQAGWVNYQGGEGLNATSTGLQLTVQSRSIGDGLAVPFPGNVQPVLGPAMSTGAFLDTKYMGSGTSSKITLSPQSDVVATGGNPGEIRYDSKNKAFWVIDLNGLNKLRKYDAASGALLLQISGPYGSINGVAIDTTHNVVWTSDYNANMLVKFDAITGAVLGSTPTFSPFQLAYDDVHDLLWVSSNNDSKIIRVNSSTGVIAGTTTVPGAYHVGILYDKKNDRVWVTSMYENSITQIDATTGVVVGAPIALGDGPMGLTMDIVRGRLWTYTSSSQLIWIDTNTTTVGGPFPVGNMGMGGIVYDDRSDQVWIPLQYTDAVAGYSGSTGQLVSANIPALSGLSDSQGPYMVSADPDRIFSG